MWRGRSRAARNMRQIRIIAKLVQFNRCVPTGRNPGRGFAVPWLTMS
jgi:hypothetical protein